MQVAKIKESNRWKIHDFLLGRSRPDLNIQALYRLIQKKGEPIKTSDERLNGVNALKYSDTEYIAIVRTPLTQSRGSFYPCKIHTFKLDIL
jgi:hypothetical protein